MAIKELIDPAKVAEDLKIDEINLNTSYKDQASLFFFYANLKRQAMQQAATAKLRRDITRSKCDKAIREAAAADGKKLTENLIEQEILRDRDYITAQMEMIAAEGIESLAKNVLDSFADRRDMLIQMGADAREQMKGELRMNGGTSSSAIDEYKRRHGMTPAPAEA